MKKSLMIVAILSLILIITACSNAGSGNTGVNTNAGNSVSTAPSDAGTGTTGAQPSNNNVKLSDSPYANYAYLISGDTLSADAQTAITGFSMQKTANPDGTTTIALSSTNPEYQNQSYTLQSGQQLYFIERTLGDDSGNEDSNLRDDMAIIVDANGYIVQ